MKRLFDAADRYLATCTWKDMALLKFCLAAIGVLIGINIPKKHKKKALIASAAVFTVTYVPLMTKFLKAALKES